MIRIGKHVIIPLGRWVVNHAISPFVCSNRAPLSNWISSTVSKCTFLSLARCCSCSCRLIVPIEVRISYSTRSAAAAAAPPLQRVHSSVKNSHGKRTTRGDRFLACFIIGPRVYDPGRVLYKTGLKRQQQAHLLVSIRFLLLLTPRFVVVLTNNSDSSSAFYSSARKWTACIV